jgi:hypothetical protein
MRDAIARYQKQTGAVPAEPGQLTTLLRNANAATTDPAKTNEIFAALTRKPVAAQTPRGDP